MTGVAAGGLVVFCVFAVCEWGPGWWRQWRRDVADRRSIRDEWERRRALSPPRPFR